MSTTNVPPKKRAILIALDHATVRINPPVCSTCYLRMEIMKSPVHDPNDGKLEQPGSFYDLYISQEDAKAIADGLYAQNALALVE